MDSLGRERQAKQTRCIGQWHLDQSGARSLLREQLSQAGPHPLLCMAGDWAPRFPRGFWALMVQASVLAASHLTVRNSHEPGIRLMVRYI